MDKGKDQIYLAIIVALLIISMIFGAMWYFRPDSASKERIKQLESDYDRLEEAKRKSDEKIVYWNNRFNQLKAQDDSLTQVISKLAKEAAAAETEANAAKSKFNKLAKELSETRKKIEAFKKNPPNRTGEALLESIKNKTSKK